MSRRDFDSFSLGRPKIQWASALRERWRQGYHFSDFKSDLRSGIVVALVALPLAMALAIATDVAPQNGLYTVITAGFIVALLGGSRFQVTGPTAAFVVVLVPVVHQYGLGGLLVAGLMAGVILLGLGAAGLGQWIQFIPHPVTTGFTSGIAVVIGIIQLKDFFGLPIFQTTENIFERISLYIQHAGSFSGSELSIGLSTLILLFVWPRFSKRIPSPLAVIGLVSLLAYLGHKFFPGWDYARIGNRFTTQLGSQIYEGVPPVAPRFDWPWNFIGNDGKPFEFTIANLEALVPSAIAIALLGAIESLLSAVVADGMARTKHDPNSELAALGVGNIVCPFFGGIAATGAIARTATNIRFGAQSPVSAMTHAAVILLILLIFAPLVSFIPMASLAALLLFIAIQMFEVRHFAHIIRVAPRSDVLVLLICFSLTVIFDMVVGVSVGVVLASLLFMRRMSNLTRANMHSAASHAPRYDNLPPGILVYEIEGPMFFGAAQRAVDELGKVIESTQVMIFVMGNVPVMDMTGLVAFESALEMLDRRGRSAILCEVRSDVANLLKRSHILKKFKHLTMASSVKEAIEDAQKLLKKN